MLKCYWQEDMSIAFDGKYDFKYTKNVDYAFDIYQNYCSYLRIIFYGYTFLNMLREMCI